LLYRISNIFVTAWETSKQKLLNALSYPNSLLHLYHSLKWYASQKVGRYLSTVFIKSNCVWIQGNYKFKHMSVTHILWYFSWLWDYCEYWLYSSADLDPNKIKVWDTKGVCVFTLFAAFLHTCAALKLSQVEWMCNSAS